MSEARFFAKVTMTGTCWLWTGAMNSKGYGRFTFNRRQIQAHHFSYMLVKGAIPEGMQLDHLCRRHNCVNPAHLEAVTPRENLMRGKTLAAENAAKTHCPQGHPYTTENTYRTGGNRRLCKTCCTARNHAAIQYRRDRYKRLHQVIPVSTSR
jgi:hypothetical protein